MRTLFIFLLLICTLTPASARAAEPLVCAPSLACTLKPAPQVTLTTAFIPGPALSPTPLPKKVAPPADPTPVRLRIPSIKLSDRIVPVGTNAKGEMEVPSGSTKNVGWYKGGALPGDIGSAVIDAHVFAAFNRLDEVPSGGDIYIDRKDGSTLHFIVERAETFALGDLSSDILFGNTGSARLNLITCAGVLTSDHSTYTHRLVVFARLVA